MTTTFALEYTVDFLGEQRTKLYKEYYSGVAQPKNVPGAKSDSQDQTRSGLGRRGA